jgi:hypothetical protein
MAKYIFKRLVHVFFTLFVFKSLAFCAGGGSSASPGDQFKAIRHEHFDTLRFSDDYPDSVSIHLFNGEKELSECLKDGELKNALTDTTEGSPLSSTKEFKHGEVDLGSERKLSFVVSYKVPTLGPAGKFFEDFVSTYCGSSAVEEDEPAFPMKKAEDGEPSPLMKKVFESAVFSVPVTFKGSTVSHFTALISYGEAWRYISPSHIEDFGFRSLSVAGLFEGEDYIKKVEWESVAPGNKRKDLSQVRYPTTSGELCLERLESKIKTIECKTVIGDRPLEASRDRLKFSMSKRQRPKDGGSDLESTLVTLVSICNGLVKLYNERADPALEQLFLGDGYLSDGSVARTEEVFIHDFKSKEEPHLFLDWEKFRGLNITGFKIKDLHFENEQKLLKFFKSVPDFNLDLDIEVVSSPKGAATKHKIREIISTPPVRLTGSEWQAYLENGRWKKISSDMVERKRRFIRNRISDQGDYSLLNFDPALDGENEGDYNKRVASGSSGTIMLLDKVTTHSVSVSKEAKTSRKRKFREEKTEVIKFEFCDLLLSKPNGKLYAIHVKRMSDSWDSATLSHLFAQGNVSASIVKNEHRTFRDHILKDLGIGNTKIKEKIEAGDFTIVFAIVAPKGETAVKSFDGLPYIAVHQLYDTIMQVESRGFPCQLTIINRATAPMAGAGGGSSGRGGSSLDSWLSKVPSTTTGS